MGSLRRVRAGFRSVFPDEGHSHANRCLARAARDRRLLVAAQGTAPNWPAETGTAARTRDRVARSRPSQAGGDISERPCDLRRWRDIHPFGLDHSVDLRADRALSLGRSCGRTWHAVRPVTDVIAFANLPRVTRGGSVNPEPWVSGRSVSLTTYINMVEKLGATIASDPRTSRST